MSNDQSRGFALVELLVVIGISIVLVGLVFAGMSKADGAAKDARCLSSLRQLGVANSLYMQDHDNRLTPSLDPYGYPPINWPDKPWYLSLQDYTGPQPDATAKRAESQSMITNEDGMRATSFCPGISRRASAGNFTGYGWNGNWGNPYFIRGTQLAYPGKTVLAWDDTQKGLANGQGDNPNGGWPSARRSEPWWYELAYRHDGKCHILMVDGHVESVKRGQFGDARDYPEFIWELPEG